MSTSDLLSGGEAASPIKGSQGGGAGGELGHSKGMPTGAGGLSQATGGGTGEVSHQAKFAGTRYGKLCDELLYVVPASRLGRLSASVEEATGQPAGAVDAPHRRRYLKKMLEAYPALVLPCWKKADLKHALRHLDAPQTGSHARLSARVFEIMLGEGGEEGETHRMMRRRRAVKASARKTLEGDTNPEELYTTVAMELGMCTDQLPPPLPEQHAGATQGEGTGGVASGPDPTAIKEARSRARKLHTLQDHVHAAAEDAATALRRLEAIHTSLSGDAFQAVSTAMGVEGGGGLLDSAFTNLRQLLAAATAAGEAVSDELQEVASQAGLKKGKKGGVTRAQVLADHLYERLHAVEGRTTLEGSESESGSEGEAKEGGTGARKKPRMAAGAAGAGSNVPPDPAVRDAVRGALKTMKF